MIAMMQVWIPRGLRAVEETLLADVTVLARARYARHGAHPDVVR
jgi:hypothetical protein